MEKIKCDIIILVVSSRGEIYDKLINNYWNNLIKFIKKCELSVKIIMIFGNDVKTDDLNIDFNSILILNTKENLIPGMLIKTLMSFEYVEKNYEYKHIFRTNLSSFLIIDELIKLSKKMDDKNIYAGVIGNCNRDLFISGAGCWLSRDNVNYILSNKKNIDYSIIEDVSIAKLMKNKIKTQLKRYDITNNININNKKLLLNNIIKDEHYHIRIKNPYNRHIDLDYMNEFTNILYTL
jgi:hypothetical protein